MERNIDEAALKFGMSPYIAKYVFFKCVIHIAYKLDTKKWQSRSSEQKQLKAIR